MIDIETQVRRCLAATAAATPVPAFPGLDAIDAMDAPSGRRRHRTIAAAAATCLVAGTGFGVAAAAGVFTGPDAFGFVQYPEDAAYAHAVPGTARPLLSAPGPDGDTIRLRVAESSGRGYCGELDDDAHRFGQVATCSDPATSFGRVDLMEGYGRAGQLATVVFSAAVPGAATVRIAYDDGTTSGPLPISENLTIGWLSPERSTHHPELVGYDADGTVMGRHDVLSAASQRQVDRQQGRR